MTGRSRQSVAAVARRERERDETLGVEEIRGSGCGCDRRRGGPGSQGGGGGGGRRRRRGEHGGLGNFSEDLRDSGRVRGSA
jgi:hypothetical protein